MTVLHVVCSYSSLCGLSASLLPLRYDRFLFFFLMIRRPPRSTLSSSSAASDVYKRQVFELPEPRRVDPMAVTEHPADPPDPVLFNSEAKGPHGGGAMLYLTGRGLGHLKVRVGNNRAFCAVVVPQLAISVRTPAGCGRARVSVVQDGRSIDVGWHEYDSVRICKYIAPSPQRARHHVSDPKYTSRWHATNHQFRGDWSDDTTVVGVKFAGEDIVFQRQAGWTPNRMLVCQLDRMSWSDTTHQYWPWFARARVAAFLLVVRLTSHGDGFCWPILERILQRCTERLLIEDDRMLRAEEHIHREPRSKDGCLVPHDRFGVCEYCSTKTKSLLPDWYYNRNPATLEITFVEDQLTQVCCVDLLLGPWVMGMLPGEQAFEDRFENDGWSDFAGVVLDINS
eukprot:TRINITY_DN5672_c0_g1_i7.p1 TRINITY_DN5672_c0_g1~~TRINITY_DN5672_c0_g1_i7.p1  ORF type:complete len:396 (-),score=54.31 TRINITY_DN5672_c0_g1_i7:201-1388(-)